MGLFSRAFKNKTFRTGTGSSLNKSADVSGSGGFASINNLQGASKASADVLHYLDSCFEEFDSDGLSPLPASRKLTNQCWTVQMNY